MRKKLQVTLLFKAALFSIICAFLFSINSKAQELIIDGNMEDSAAWNFYWGPAGADTGFHQFNYTADIPSAGSGGAFRVSSYGQTASFLWQPVTITPGNQYSMSGALKDIATDTATNTWFELILTRMAPGSQGDDVQPVAGDFRYTLNTWMGESLDFDGTFQDDFQIDASPDGKNMPVFTMPDTITMTDWYVIMKVGSWNDLGSTDPTFDYVIDDISLIDLGVPQLVADGNMEDSTGWNFYWGPAGADTGFHQFNYTADIPSAGSGGAFRVSSFGQTASFLWQPVTITPGNQYEFSGALKDIAPDTAANTWFELILTRAMPGSQGEDVQPVAGDFRYTLNTWMGESLDFDGTFEDDFQIDASPDGKNMPVFTIPDTVTITNWYIVIKVGSWNDLGSTDPTFDYVIDDISLIDLGLPDLIEGYSMEDASAWNFYWGPAGADTGFHEFNYTADVPSAGMGGCFRVSSYGQTASFLWQPVSITPGNQYMFTGAMKDIAAATALNTWFELILTRAMPGSQGEDVQPVAGDFRYTLNTWMGVGLDFDGTFQDDFQIDASPDGQDSIYFTIPDTVSMTDWYVVLKVGSWNDLGSTDPTFDYLIDEIRLIDLGIVNVESISLAFANANDSLMVGESAAVMATVSPAYASSTAVDWGVSDEGIATIDEDGNLTGVAAGIVTVTATSVFTPSVEETIDITVYEASSVSNTIAGQLSIYPNPVTDQLNIIGTENLKNVTILDLTGKNVKQVEVNKSDVRINVQDLANGIYFLKIQTADKETIVKIVKN
ncbi:MAG: T9SS type A sorting domain-containing protein [Bacteroidales bacterium]|nr:MAG: T9SS type A sorting domain-containing protein [Bacteroidales bacterium]